MEGGIYAVATMPASSSEECPGRCWSGHTTLPPITNVATLVRGVGRWVRNTRYLLGISQDTLASIAGTSQGAISRLEAGRSADTPLMTYVKAITALARELAFFGKVAPVPPYVQDALAFAAYLNPQTGDLPPPISDETFSALVLRYASMSPTNRRVFLNVTASLAEYLVEKDAQ